MPSAEPSVSRPLLEVLPVLSRHVRFAGLGVYPTPCETLHWPAEAGAGNLFIKRDDLSSPVYGGNKVRTLEVLLADACSKGLTRAVATGAQGSNHAVATVLHAPRLGLASGALLCPQPASAVARENFEVTCAYADRLLLLPHWSWVPFAIWRWRKREPNALVMPPGGASPLGALGYVSAAFELAEQMRRHEVPEPRNIVLPIGSTCTSAGLLVGLRLVQALGLGFAGALPQIYAVRVTPWPVTSAWRTLGLAQRTAAWLAQLCGQPAWAFSRAQLGAGLVLNARYLGAGYGKPSAAGEHALQHWSKVSTRGLAASALAAETRPVGPILDSTYSAKAAAALLGEPVLGQGPTLFWATKSSAPLPPLTPDDHSNPNSLR